MKRSITLSTRYKMQKHQHQPLPLILLILLASISFAGLAQNAGDVSSPASQSSTLRQSSIGKANLHTGVPDISFPLYTVQSKKLSYPIVISYNALGVKVSEPAGLIGQNWFLNGGGVITRAFRGGVDESSHGYFSNASAIPDETSSVPFSTKTALLNGTYDMLPDIFFYNTGTSTGRFLFDNTLTPQSLPKSDVVIQVSNTTDLSTITIIGADGTSYIFQGGETMTFADGVPYYSTWYLSSIVSADHTDTITFIYNTKNPSYYTTNTGNGVLEYFETAPEGASIPPYPNNTLLAACPNCTVGVGNSKYLTQIQYAQGQIDFLPAPRTDNAGFYLYESISIKRKNVNGAMEIVKNIKFNYSYFQNVDTGTRLRLDGFTELNSSNKPIRPAYQFFYSDHKIPNPGSFQQDKWGYYNGATGNKNLIPNYGTNLEVNGSFSDGLIISKVKNPLGGTTEYFFEPNDYGPTRVQGPGLRINKIITTDPYSSIKAITNYDYKDPSGNGSGVLTNLATTTKNLNVRDGNGSQYVYTGLLMPMNPNGLGNYNDSPVIYEYVTQYEGSSANVSGKTVSRYTVYTPSSHDFPYMPETDNSWQGGKLRSKSIYKVSNGVSTLVRNVVNTYNDQYYPVTIKGLKAFYNTIPINTPVINADIQVKNFTATVATRYLSSSIVKVYEQNSNTLATTQTTTYTYDHLDQYLAPNKITTTTSETGISQQQVFSYPLDYPHSGIMGTLQDRNIKASPIETILLRTQGTTEYVIGYQKTDYATWGYGIYPQNIYRAKLGTSSVLRSAFESNRSAYCQVDQTINQYDASGFISEMQRPGDVPQVTLTDGSLYPPVATVRNAAANQVAYSSFETPDFGNWQFFAGRHIDQTPRSFGQFTNEVPKTFTLTSTQSVTYTVSFTDGNPLGGGPPTLVFSRSGYQSISVPFSNGSVSLAAGTWNVTLSWDSQDTAGAVITYYDVTATLPYPVQYLPFSITGTYSLLFENGHVIRKVGLPPGDYLLTYYENGGGSFATLGGATVLNATTVTISSSWSLQRKTIHITSLTDGVQLAGDFSLDELRLYPVNAMINTVCYDLKGNLITETDINLRSQFYEYDAFGRLSVKRDHDHNVLTEYEYNYAGNQ